MRSWPTPVVPSLAQIGYGTGPAVRVFDSAHGALVESDPEQAARLYVCGITPYDATHMGHAATYLAFDLLQRAWRDRGLSVLYTQNVTDVDDPLLERAAATGVDWNDLAERETELFRTDMVALNVIAPDHYIGAVEAIDLVVELIQKLDAAGAVYRVDDDLYFRVQADPAFGSVSGLDLETMNDLFAERGGDPDRPGKEDRLDCLLWQSERPGEPAWDTAFGRGRPGWHIECSSMALHYLGTDFDVQGGGSDLIFPHHEMSASEAQVATGDRFAKAYVHAGMVGFEGEKMSKSKGNLVLVSRVRHDGVDPMAIRLALLAHHYRTDWEWVDADLEEALQRLARWRTGFGRQRGPAAAPAVAALRDALSHDLDAPRALAIVDAWADADGDDAEAPEVIHTAIDALLGVAMARTPPAG